MSKKTKQKRRIKQAQFVVKEKIDTASFSKYDSETSNILHNIIYSKNVTNEKKLPFYVNFGLEKRYNIVAALYIAAINTRNEINKQLEIEKEIFKKEFPMKVSKIKREAESSLGEAEEVSEIANRNVTKNTKWNKLMKKNMKRIKKLNEWKDKKIEKTKKAILTDATTLERKIFKLDEKLRENITSCISTKIYRGAVFYTSNIKEVTADNIIIARNVNKKMLVKNKVLPILNDINLNVRKGEMVAIIGKSGSGKTTLLNILSGIDYATSGDVLFTGANLTYMNDAQKMRFRQNHIAFVFQANNLLDNISALGNVMVGSRYSSKRIKRKQIYEMFELLGLKGMEKKKPPNLSGGQQQRVAIARALLKYPDILFCDELTSSLDKKTGQGIIDLLKKIQEKYHMTIVIVTHHPNIARQAERIIEIENGKIIESSIKTNLEMNAAGLDKNINLNSNKVEVSLKDLATLSTNREQEAEFLTDTDILFNEKEVREKWIK